MKWWDKSWNPVTGCSPISEGCDRCYAETMFSRNLWGYDFSPRFHPDRLSIPQKWKKPKRIFVCSMGDLFHENIGDNIIDNVFEAMDRARQHTYMICTKRPERAKNYIALEVSAGFNNDHLWLGVTAENRARADERIPILLDTPAAHRFISVEPMLEYINIEEYTNRLDWVICGGESGQGAREMDGDWARDLRNQCREAGVPFFFKQMSSGMAIPGDLLVRELPG